MENQKKCSLKDHSNINAVSYCQKCEVYMCNKCNKFHQDLCANHLDFIINDNINELFNEICKEEKNHSKLNYFCKNHNKLCCLSCIAKIKGEGIGQHKDCDVFFIKEIKDEKINKLKENIKYLEDFSKSLELSINELKNLFNEINENKEQLKIDVQKIFTNLRNALNNREDELLNEIDKEFNNIYGNDDIIRKGEKFPEKIKKSIEKGKSIENEFNNNKLISVINDCISIENNINDISKINETIDKCKNNNKIKINLYLNDEEINNLTEKIKNIGKISYNQFINSKIKFDENLVKDWIGKNFTSELLFSTSKNGFKPTEFHRLCDNKGPTIIFIETKKGCIFGGYTELDWDKSDQYKTDESTFLFSINNKAKYTRKNKLCSIYCRDDLAPSFGGNGNPDFYCMGSCERGSLCNKNTFATKEELNNGDSSFEVKEMEVYQIKFK